MSTLFRRSKLRSVGISFPCSRYYYCGQPAALEVQSRPHRRGVRRRPPSRAVNARGPPVLSLLGPQASPLHPSYFHAPRSSRRSNHHWWGRGWVASGCQRTNYGTWPFLRAAEAREAVGKARASRVRASLKTATVPHQPSWHETAIAMPSRCANDRARWPGPS